MLWMAIIVALLWLGIALDVVGRSLARPYGSGIRHEDEKNAPGTAIFDARRIGSAKSGQVSLVACRWWA